MKIKVLQDIKAYSFLIQQLTKVSLLAELKRSYLGWLWLVLLPLIAILTWLFMKGSGILEPGETEVSYPVFVLLNTLFWTFFYDIYRRIAPLLLEQGRTLLMNEIPVSILIIKEITVHFIRFIIPFIIITAAILIFGTVLSWKGIFLPILLLPLLLLGLSIGFIGSLLQLLILDLGKALDESMKILLFLTPVIYASNSTSGILRKVTEFNPLTYLIEGCRELLTLGIFPTNPTYWICYGVIFVLFFILLQFYISAAPKALEYVVNN